MRLRSHADVSPRHSYSICEYLISLSNNNLEEYDMSDASSLFSDFCNRTADIPSGLASQNNNNI